MLFRSINKYQALLDNGSYEGGMYAMLGKQPLEAASQEAYTTICKEILTRWLSQVSREAMLSTLNTIGIISGTVSYLPGETLSAQALMIEWNKANPDASPISVNTSIL